MNPELAKKLHDERIKRERDKLSNSIKKYIEETGALPTPEQIEERLKEEDERRQRKEFLDTVAETRRTLNEGRLFFTRFIHPLAAGRSRRGAFGLGF
ncbi:MAG: hypothetical protein ACK4NC_07525 [Candidatus Gracilibacteria bacterium]